MGPRLRGGVFTWYGDEICSPPQFRPYRVNATTTLFFYYVWSGVATIGAAYVGINDPRSYHRNSLWGILKIFFRRFWNSLKFMGF